MPLCEQGARETLKIEQSIFDFHGIDEPMTALGRLRGTVVIDEVQRRPEFLPALRVLADRRPLRARFLILGSASPGLLQQSSETLAGRLEIVTLSGFSTCSRAFSGRGSFNPGMKT